MMLSILGTNLIYWQMLGPGAIIVVSIPVLLFATTTVAPRVA
jgi:hypothetical protein